MSSRRWRGVAVAAAALVALEGAAAGGGAVELAGGGAGVPAWVRTCAERPPRPDREPLAPCARLAGRVIAVRHDGAGAGRETHLLVAARLHAFVVKLPPGAAAPGLGRRTLAIGPLVRARNGLREVEAFRVGSP